MINGIAQPTVNIGNNQGTATITASIDNTLVKTSVYVPSVDMYLMVYPWYYDDLAGTYQNSSDYDDTIVYTVDVRNIGANDATGVVVNTVLGSGYQYVNCSTEGVGTATYNNQNGILTWNIGNMPSGGMVWLSIFALVTGTGNNTPNLTVNSSLYHVDQYDVPNKHKSASYSIYVEPSVDVQVKQNQTTSTVNGTTYVTYTVTATNNGPSNATGVQITDYLPGGLANPTITTSTGTFTGGVWTIPSLANGSSATLTITAEVTATGGTIVNTASLLNTDQYDWNYNDESQTCTYTVSGTYTPSVDMYLMVYPWYYDDLAGTYQNSSDYDDTIVYTVDVRNIGANDATGVVVNTVLGSGYQYVNCSTEGVGTATYNNQNGILTWNIGNMPSGGMVWLSIFALVTGTGNNTPNLTVNSSLYHVDQYDVPNKHKSASYSIYVEPSVDVQVKQNQTTSTVNGTTYVTYTVTATNNGPSNATGVQITDYLPGGLANPTITTSTGTFTGGVWTIPSLANGSSATLTITAEVTATGGTIVNTASLLNTDQYDWNYNDESQETIHEAGYTN